jgi:hypothetical protein
MPGMGWLRCEERQDFTVGEFPGLNAFTGPYWGEGQGLKR